MGNEGWSKTNDETTSILINTMERVMEDMMREVSRKGINVTSMTVVFLDANDVIQ